MAILYARRMNQNDLKYQTLLSARFDKPDKGDQVLDEIGLYNNLNYNGNLTESGIDNIDVRSQLEQQQQIQETKSSRWRFQLLHVFVKLVK